MPNRTYRVRVLLPESPKRDKYVESPAHGFTVQARTHDAAAAEARVKANGNGLGVRSLSHSPNGVITILAERKAVTA